MKPMKTICPLFYHENGQLSKQMKRAAVQGFDLVELRLDEALAGKEGLAGLAALKKEAEIPWILTIRTQREGGMADLSLQEYSDLTAWLLKQFPDDLVDIELSSFLEMKSKPDVSRVILSYHNFQKTPDNLAGIFEQMDQYRPAIQKIAVMPENEQDVERLLQACKNHQSQSEKIAISMSKLGRRSRISGAEYGSAYTFAVMDESSAPGQVSLEELKEYWKTLT